MLERKNTNSIPKEIINEEIIDIPPVPVETRNLTSQEFAYLCSELSTIPQVLTSGPAIKITTVNKHLKILKKVLPVCENYQNIVLGIVHKFADINKKNFQIHLNNHGAQTLELYSSILKHCGKNFTVNLKQENEHYFIEVTYSC